MDLHNLVMASRLMDSLGISSLVMASRRMDSLVMEGTRSLDTRSLDMEAAMGVATSSRDRRGREVAWEPRVVRR